MKKLIVGICLLGCLASCIGGKKNTEKQEEQMEWTDSIEATTDSLLIEEVEEEPVIPASADESFADFLYNFALDERLQLRRILFPLPYYMDNQKDSILKEDWVHDPLFSQQEFYTMLYDNLDDAELEKDTASTSVRIEWIDLKKKKLIVFSLCLPIFLQEILTCFISARLLIIFLCMLFLMQKLMKKRSFLKIVFQERSRLYLF